MIDKDETAEDVLSRLMREYDELLAHESSPESFDDSAIERDTDLQREWQETKECLERLHQANRSEHSQTRRGSQASEVADRGGAGDAPNEPLQFISRFNVERELGHGGMGVVFLAFDPRTVRHVAIKIPRLEAMLSSDLRRRFQREAEAAARLSHPNLVALLEVGDDEPFCYLVSEFCAGPNLAEWMRGRSVPVPTEQAASIVMQLAEGVQHAHSRGVLHRDIKPSNVLLQPQAAIADEMDGAADASFIPKLTDFGMAKLLESAGDETRSGAHIGTAAYMAPEQAEGRIHELDARTDVYALGVVLYELLAGAVPFRGNTTFDTLRQLTTYEPVPLCRVRRDLARDLEAIALKCLNKKQDDRYATAHELAADLRRFLSHEPTVARPLNWWQTAGKWATRRPMAAALVAVSLLAMTSMVAAGVLYTLQVRRHADELSALLAARDEARAEAQHRASSTAQSYVGDLRYSHQAWREGRLAEANAKLAEHQPRGEDPDHRTFAWHYLWRLTHPEAITLQGHNGNVYACRFSPDGQLLASAGEDGEVRVWNPSLGTLERSWKAHAKDIHKIAYSPDGNWIATISKGHGAAVWNARTGAKVHALEQFAGTLRDVAFTAKGQTLLVIDADGKLQQLQTSDWSLQDVASDWTTPVLSLAISPDESTVAVAGEDRVIRLASAPDLRIIATLDGHASRISALAFSKDGRRLASAGQSGPVKLWDVRSQELEETYKAEGGSPVDIAFTSADQILVASQRGGARLLRSTKENSRAVQASTAPVYSVATAPRGLQIATGGADEIVRVWKDPRTADGSRLSIFTPGHVMAVAPGLQVAVGDHLGVVRFFDLASGELRQTFEPHRESINGLCFSDDGALLAAAFADNTVRLWRYPELEPLGTLQGPGERIQSIKFSPDTATLAICGADSSILLCDTASCQRRSELATSGDGLLEIAFSPSGEFLAGGGSQGLVRLWRLSNGQALPPLKKHSDEVLSVAWSPDGKLLASGGKDDRICVWNVSTQALEGQIASTHREVRSLAFASDGSTLASCGQQNSIKLWDVSSRAHILNINGYYASASSVQFTKQGDALLAFQRGDPCGVIAWRAPSVNSTSHSDEIVFDRE